MIRSLYSLLAFGAQPLLRSKLRRRGQANRAISGRGGALRALLGHTRSRGVVDTCVSLGETRAAAILIERLRSLKPDLRVLLTHGTATGRAEGERLLQTAMSRPGCLGTRPRRCGVSSIISSRAPVVLMETEVWPNLVAVSRKQRAAAGAGQRRLSEKSLAKAQRLALLSRPAYASLTAVWAQTEDDAQRLAQAGATVKGVFGNLKFDAPPTWRSSSTDAVGVSKPAGPW
jgi:3-deoxy-D-manno-octulosonic-acid transferase